MCEEDGMENNAGKKKPTQTISLEEKIQKEEQEEAKGKGR